MKRNSAFSIFHQTLSLLLIAVAFSFLGDREVIKSITPRDYQLTTPPTPSMNEIDQAITAVAVYSADGPYSYETTPAMREILSKFYVVEYQYPYEEHNAAPTDLRAARLRDSYNLAGQFLVQFVGDDFGGRGALVNVRGANGYRARERLGREAGKRVLAEIRDRARLNAELTVSLLGKQKFISKVINDRPESEVLSSQHERTALSPSDVVRQYWKASAEGKFNQTWRYIDVCGLDSKYSIDREIIKSLTQRTPWIIRNNPKIPDRKLGELAIGRIEEESLKGDTASVVAIVHFRNNPVVRSLFRLKHCKGEWKIENAEVYYKDVFDLRNKDNKKIAALPLHGSFHKLMT